MNMSRLCRRDLKFSLAASTIRPVWCGLIINERKVHYLAKSGRGGRSSNPEVLATVFGSTGFVGRYVVNRLGRNGTQMMLPYRDDEYSVRHMRLMGDLGQIMFRFFDIRDPKSLSELVQHSDVVINLIGQFWRSRNFTLEDVNIDRARAIARACRENGVKRLIHISALNASEKSPSHWLRTKAEGEKAVLEEFPDATIFRPSDIFGQEDKFFNYYTDLRLLPFGVPLVDRGLKTTKIPVYVADVARAITKATFDDETAGKTYQLVGPQEYLLYDLVGTIFRHARRRFKTTNMPKSLYNFILGITETVGYIPWLTRDALIRQNLSDVVSSDLPGLEDLGIEKTTVDSIATFILRNHIGCNPEDKVDLMT